MRSVLLQLHIGKPVECTAWSDVPVTNGVQITVYTRDPSSVHAANCARHCFSKLKHAFWAAGGRQTPAPCIQVHGAIFGAYTCGGAVPGLHQRILIYIADGVPAIDPYIEGYFLQPGALIIPVVDDSLGKNIPGLIPASFDEQRAENISNFKIAPIIPGILRAANIITDGLRLFISYRHDDAAEIASQLFHKLSEKMFDVFLDRFSGRTGDNFVERVREEIFDKACVLVLETPDLYRSSYCRQEIAYATAYRLGLMAVDLPGSKRIYPQAWRRCDLSSETITNDKLSPAQLDSAVDFVLKHYDEQVARRVRNQDLKLFQSIKAAGLNPVKVGVGQYTAQKTSGNYLFTMCTRPPEVENFIDCEEEARIRAANAYIFGPISVLRTQRAQKINWLGDKSLVRPVDEGLTMRTIKHL